MYTMRMDVSLPDFLFRSLLITNELYQYRSLSSSLACGVLYKLPLTERKIKRHIEISQEHDHETAIATQTEHVE